MGASPGAVGVISPKARNGKTGRHIFECVRDMLWFRLTLLALTFCLQFLVYREAEHWARGLSRHSAAARWVIGVCFLVFNVAYVGFIFLHPHLAIVSTWLKISVIYPMFIWYSATLVLGLLLLVLLVVKLPFRLLLSLSRTFPQGRRLTQRISTAPTMVKFDRSRRIFLRRTMVTATATAFLGSSYGVFVGRKDYELTEQAFTIDGLDPTLDGFTIGLVTDIHSSMFMQKKDMDKFVKRVNAFKPDMILVGGDFVNSLTEEVYPFAESFSNLSAPHGVFGVMGNHDFYAGNPDRVAREVDACGVRLLHDSSVTIRRGDARLVLLGIDDTSLAARAQEKIQRALHAAPRQYPRILLCHRPYYLPQAAQEGIHLMLSGHTHGGQVVLARLGGLALTPAAFTSPYLSGVYRSGGTAMYVSRGIGTVAIPVRINCPPEITRIVLRCTKASA